MIRKPQNSGQTRGTVPRRGAGDVGLPALDADRDVALQQQRA